MYITLVEHSEMSGFFRYAANVIQALSTLELEVTLKAVMLMR